MGKLRHSFFRSELDVCEFANSKNVELTQYDEKKRLVNVDHITDVAISILNGRTLVGLSNNIDGDSYIEVKETLEQIKYLVNGEHHG